MRKSSDKKLKSIAFFSVVAIAIIIIIYYMAYSNQNDNLTYELNQAVENTPASSAEPVETPDPSPDINFVAEETPTSTPQPTQAPDTKSEKISDAVPNSTPIPVISPSPVNSPVPVEKEPENVDGIRILKSDITSTAKFYPYKVGNTSLEVIAVKADDGTVRTALNTCQVCYDSGRGYYEQVGKYLICQNCQNRFSINQIELIKGGCNPVPILAEDKTETSNDIFVLEDYLSSQKKLFSNWNNL